MNKKEIDFVIEYADEECFDFLKNLDKHISAEMIEKKIQDKEVVVIKDSTKIIGWLRFGYFWDEHPFVNMLMIEKTYRGRGLGKKLVHFWEKEMKKRDFEFVLTSTSSNEQAQHFYRKIGYKDSGCLLLEGEVLEIIFRKNLKNIRPCKNKSPRHPER